MRTSNWIPVTERIDKTRQYCSLSWSEKAENLLLKVAHKNNKGEISNVQNGDMNETDWG